VPLKGRGGYNHQPQKAELIYREEGGGGESREPEGMRGPEQGSSRTYYAKFCVGKATAKIRQTGSK